jgi:ribonuclease BN (tRNA processing enzyme)
MPRQAILLVICALMTSTSTSLPAQSTQSTIVLLGTGTPRAIPERSGPATAIVVGDRAYLVDVGPGVVRRAAAAAAKGIAALEPTRISVAFVTHLHSDHTAGYPDLILTPWVMGRPELNVYGPDGLEDMTKYILLAWKRDIEIRTTGLEHRRPLVVHAHDVKPGVAYKDDRVTVTAFRVPHGQWDPAFGYRFTTPDRTIVISGDTSPSDEIVAQCHGCDVLIHEAYSPNAPKPPMEDWESYRVKYHTSTEQLAEIANRAKPKLLILYHQSGRAPDEQMLSEVHKGYAGKVVIGRDLDVY